MANTLRIEGKNTMLRIEDTELFHNTDQILNQNIEVVLYNGLV